MAARHLQDPETIRRNYERLQAAERANPGVAPEVYAGPRGGRSLSQVQKWVMSVLAVTTIGHLSAGITLAAIFSDRTDAKIGLNVIAAFIGVVAVAAGFLIHKRSPLTPWLLLGLLPGVVGAWVCFH